MNGYSYDTLSRLVTMQQQSQTGGNAVASKEIDYAYNAVGDVTGRSAFNFIGVGPRYDIATSAISYNPLGLLTSISMTSHGGQVALDNLTYSYDTLGRVSTFSSIDGTATYGYGKTSQLTSASYVAASGHTEPANFLIAFDPNGNRSTVNGASTTISSNNEVTNDGTFTYQFDSAGNRTVRARISTAYASDYKTTYAWDYRNRLTDVENFDNNGVLTQHVHYAYDVWDHLIERELDPNGSGTYTVDTHYVWDAIAPPTLGVAGQPPNAPGNIVLAFNGSEQLTTRYLLGPNTSAYDPYLTTLAEEDVSSTSQPGTLTFDLPDKQGSLVDVADDSGALANHVEYTAFGQDFNETNPSVPHIAGFGGGFYDAATGLINNVERWYDPLATVWISVDPTGFRAGDLNERRYVGSNPTNLMDPSGEAPPASAKEIPLATSAFEPDFPELDMDPHDFMKTMALPPWAVEHVDRTGCWALLQLRLGMYTAGMAERGDSPKLPVFAPGARIFTNRADAARLVLDLSRKGHRPRMFLFQSSEPSAPIAGYKPPDPKFPSEVPLDELRQPNASGIQPLSSGAVNYASVHYYKFILMRNREQIPMEGCYYEWVNNRGGNVRHSRTFPGGIYKHNWWVVIPDVQSEYLPPQVPPSPSVSNPPL